MVEQTKIFSLNVNQPMKLLKVIQQSVNERVSTSHLLLNRVNQPHLLVSHYCWPDPTADQPQLLVRLNYWPATITGQTSLLTSHNYWSDFTADQPQLQLNPALTDFRGPTNFICYRRNSVRANIWVKRKWIQGTKI